MKKLFSALVLVLAAVVMTGCVQVNPGEVGKKITASGVQPGHFDSGKHWRFPWERMIKIDISSERRPAQLSIRMADWDVTEFADEAGGTTTSAEQRLGLNMDFSLNVRYRIRNNPETITMMLSDMRLDRVDEVTASDMYDKYGFMIVGRVAREVLGRYTPEEVYANLTDINKELFSALADEFSRTPLEVTDASLGPFDLPDVISARISENKDTELSEVKARAQQHIDLLKKRNEIELARQQAIREEVDAKSLAEQNRILSASVTPDVIRLRELQIREKEIEMMGHALTTGNATSIFIPYGSMDNTGAQVRMFNQQ